jgi:hypothetical protein
MVYTTKQSHSTILLTCVSSTGEEEAQQTTGYIEKKRGVTIYLSIKNGKQFTKMKSHKPG